MKRSERILLYGISVLVVAGLLASGFGRREGGIRPGVRAAECHDNAPLDVLRRGISFAQETSIGERDRAAKLEKVSVLFESFSLAALQDAVTYSLITYRAERKAAMQLQNSSVQGDRQLAREAFLRAQDWYKTEKTLRGIYMAEVKRMTKEEERHKTRAKEARQRSQDWHETEGMLKAIFTAEVERMNNGGRIRTTEKGQETAIE